MEDTRPQNIAASWDGVAAGYDQHVTPHNEGFGARVLERIDLGPGTRFLDVACGSGALAIPAARRGAEVTAVDLSPAMVERLRQRAISENLAVDARVMDGQALDLSDDSFDCVGSQFGVMLFPDLGKGMREMARVARPGGQVVIAAFGNPAELDFLSFFVRSVQAAAPQFTGLPKDPPPLPFQLSDPDRFQRRMEDAGLRDVRIEATVEELRVGTGADLWSWLLSSNPIPGRILADLDLDDAQLEMAQQRMAALVEERAGDRGEAILSHPMLIGTGRK